MSAARSEESKESFTWKLNKYWNLLVFRNLQILFSNWFSVFLARTHLVQTKSLTCRFARLTFSAMISVCVRSSSNSSSSWLSWASIRFFSSAMAFLKERHISIQVIPRNLQKYLSTNGNLLRCKTLPAHFNKMVVVQTLCLQKSPGHSSECSWSL